VSTVHPLCSLTSIEKSNPSLLCGR
jgi:hypothetical protein